MKPDFEFYILFAVTSLAFFINIKYGIAMIFFCVLIYTFSFFLTSQGIFFNLVELNDKVFIYKNFTFTGDYSQAYSKLADYHALKKELKLDENFYPCGIFYNNPEKKDKKKKEKINDKNTPCKASLGFILNKQMKIQENLDEEEEQQQKSSKKNKKNKEKEKKEILPDIMGYNMMFSHKEDEYDSLLNKLREKGFQTKKLSEIETVYGWYTTFFSMRNSFSFVVKYILSVAIQKYFSRIFYVNWKEKSVSKAKSFYLKKDTVIVVLTDYNVGFYLPVTNEEDVMLHNNKID